MIAITTPNEPISLFFTWLSNGKAEISRELLLETANDLGFRYYKGDTVRVIDNFIFDITERQFQDILKRYVDILNLSPEKYEKVASAYEAFMQKNGAYTMTRVKELTDDYILKDDKFTSYKFYKNGFLKITAEDIIFLDYSSTNLLIWQHSVQQRNYTNGHNGDFIDFINKATIYPQSVKNIIGYLAHEYKDETTGYIIVLTESCPNPQDGGGSGKNLFGSLLKLTTSYTSKPGAQAKFDEKFFQSWNRERIFAISDVPKNFDFLFLKEPSTGVFIWKKLFKDEIEIPVSEGPKFIVQTNYSYEISDGGLKRRIIPLEFSDFFTKKGGVDVYYKKYFPDDWNDDDYAGFDTYVAHAIRLWLKSGRKLSANELTETGKTKQWEQTYGQVAADFILSHISLWIPTDAKGPKDIANYLFKNQLESYFSENSIGKNYQPSLIKINRALEAFCENNGILFKKDVVVYDATNTGFKSRVFENTDKRLPF